MRTQLFFFTEDVLTGSIGQISLGSTLKLCEVVTWALSWFDAPCRAAYLFFKATRQGAVATEVAGTGCHCFLASKSSRLARWREDREPSLWGVLSACTPLAQPPFIWSHWTQVLSLLPPSRSTGSGTPCSQRPGHLRVCLHGSSAWVPHFFWHWLLSGLQPRLSSFLEGQQWLGCWVCAPLHVGPAHPLWAGCPWQSTELCHFPCSELDWLSLLLSHKDKNRIRIKHSSSISSAAKLPYTLLAHAAEL